MNRNIRHFLWYFIGHGRNERPDINALAKTGSMQIKDYLEKFMYLEKPFLNPRYTIRDLSKDIRKTSRTVTEYIKHNE